MLDILLIDDDELEHLLFKDFLNSRGELTGKFCSACSLKDALSILSSRKFSYIFLDDRLGMHSNALESLPALRNLSGKANIVVISSSLDAIHLHDKQDLGVYDIIDKRNLKPFLINLLTMEFST